jgi:CubicO group peptidase (beta-lactamase class C family)
MESGINARPIDFAKLGRLYLAGGAWDGEQLVRAGWIEESTRPSETAAAVDYPGRFEQAYGRISHENLWWRIARPDGSYAYSALGNHGQFVFVSPTDDLIIVRNGERYGVSSFEWFDIFLAVAEGLRDG